jgi:hypothetical protein
MSLSVYTGDPTTPGYPTYENATRVEATYSQTLALMCQRQEPDCLDSLGCRWGWGGAGVRALLPGM